MWYGSLYNGDNLNTQYSWESDPPSLIRNIAYGKRTIMSSFVFTDRYPYIDSSGCAVNGLKSPRSGFFTGKDKNPFWVIDLHHPQSIGSIKVYESIKSSTFNLRPIKIIFFNDEKKRNHELSITSEIPGIELNFTNPITARYIQFIATGVCQLSFDEVEIYPPDSNRQ